MSTYVLDHSNDVLARILELISVAGTAFTSMPPTSIVGAILWGGNLGNIVATHVCIT